MWRDLRVAGKLGIGFGVVIGLALLLGLVAWGKLKEIGGEWNDFESGTLRKRNAVTLGFSGLQDGIHHFKNFVLRGGDYAQKFSGDMTTIERAAADYRRTGDPSEEEKKLLGQIEQGAKNYRLAMDEAVNLANAGKTSGEIDKAIKGADKVLDEGFKNLQGLNLKRTGEASAKFRQAVEQAALWIASLGALIVILGIFAAWVITRAITVPLGLATIAVEKVADGDLTVRLEPRGRDETGRLISNLQGLIVKLTGIIGEVRAAADNLTNAAGQVSATAQSLSQSSSEQAASVEETTA
ncbi:MAG: methyl-accepting chemotaxis protein, partial [Betaproteobacteria bacterium]|nr:methyl-accepting chemotaxis protein [Betaproteobacteria bacterium]